MPKPRALEKGIPALNTGKSVPPLGALARGTLGKSNAAAKRIANKIK